jgi:hypothetical protein
LVVGDVITEMGGTHAIVGLVLQEILRQEIVQGNENAVRRGFTDRGMVYDEKIVVGAQRGNGLIRKRLQGTNVPVNPHIGMQLVIALRRRHHR